MGPGPLRPVILLSGGLDSAAELYRESELAPKSVRALFVDYGQVSAAGEELAARDLAAARGVVIEVARAPGLAALGSGAMVDRPQAEVADGESVDQRAEWFPARNLLLVALAAATVGRDGGGAIRLGASSNVYRDANPQFFQAAAKAVAASLAVPVDVETPTLDRELALQRAVRNGLDVRRTFSCNRRGDRHCWRCASCQDRRRLLWGLDPPLVRPSGVRPMRDNTVDG